MVILSSVTFLPDERLVSNGMEDDHTLWVDADVKACNQCLFQGTIRHERLRKVMKYLARIAEIRTGISSISHLMESLISKGILLVLCLHLLDVHVFLLQ
jgi:hypothetical protein